MISLPKDALAACNYLPQSREKIIAALFKALNSTNSELQEAGEACMRKVSEWRVRANVHMFCLQGSSRSPGLCTWKSASREYALNSSNVSSCFLVTLSLLKFSTVMTNLHFIVNFWNVRG